MTVSSTSNKSGPYTANGVTTSFAWTGFRVIDESDLKVYTTEDNVDTEVTSGFSITGVPGTSGTVVFDEAPEDGTVITIIRESDMLQESDYANEGRVTPAQVELDLDRAIMAIQDLSEKLDRAVKVSVSEDASPDELSSAILGLYPYVSELRDLYGVISDIEVLAPIASEIANVSELLSDAIAAAEIAETSEVNAAASAVSAAASAASAISASAGALRDAAAAQAAAEASGDVLFFDTKADADAALSGLSEDQIVEVFVDESYGNKRTRYRVESGALVFKLDLDSVPVYATVFDLRSSAAVGASWERVKIGETGDSFVWVDDLTLDDNGQDCVLPDGHTGAGRWLRLSLGYTPPAITPLPRLTAKSYDLSIDTDYTAIVIADSLGAKYTTNPAGQTFTDFLSDQFAGRTREVLAYAQSVSGGAGGAAGSVISKSDDSAIGMVGYYYDVSDGETIRLSSFGSNPFADKVRVFYVKSPGDGDLTLTLTHEDGSGYGQTSTTVDMDAPAESGYVELTLAGNITGESANNRVLVDITASGGSVKILPWAFAYDTSKSGAFLTFNRWGSRGGYTFPDAAAFDASSAVLGKQVIDQNPDLVIFEFADPLVSGREYIESMLEYLSDNEFFGDILLIGSPMVYEAGYSDDMSGDATTINGTLVDNQRLMAGYYKVLAAQYPNVRFFDYGAVIRSQGYGLDGGFYLDSDHTHPQSKGLAAMLSALARSIPTASVMRGWQYFRSLAARAIYLPGTDGADINDISVTATIEGGASGDLSINWRRSLEFYNWLAGVSSLVAKIDQYGVYAKELRFTDSTSKFTSTTNGEISANYSKLKFVSNPYDGLDAVNLNSITATEDATSLSDASSSINTSGKFRGKFCWDNTNNRMMRSMGSGPTDSWITFDGSTTVTPS
jgi:hypothetical protein